MGLQLRMYCHSHSQQIPNTRQAPKRRPQKVSWHFGSLNLVGRFWILRRLNSNKDFSCWKGWTWSCSGMEIPPEIYRISTGIMTVWTWYVSCACCVVSLSSTKLHILQVHETLTKKSLLAKSSPYHQSLWRYTHAYVRDNCKSSQKGSWILEWTFESILHVGQWVCQCTFMAIHNERFNGSGFHVFSCCGKSHIPVCVKC